MAGRNRFTAVRFANGVTGLDRSCSRRAQFVYVEQKWNLSFVGDKSFHNPTPPGTQIDLELGWVASQRVASSNLELAAMPNGGPDLISGSKDF